MILRNLLILDCDGVLTPNKTFYNATGKIIKIFSSNDSYAIKDFQGLDFDIVILTADKEGLLITEARAKDWGVKVICSNNKLKEVKKLKQTTQYNCIYYAGNGPEDISVISEVDLFFAPRDSRPEILNSQNKKLIVLNKDGGDGVLDDIFKYINNGSSH